MMRRDAGFSLLEMAVAVLILSIAVVGLCRTFDANLRASDAQRDRVLALMVAQNRAESIALGLNDLPPTERYAARDWIVETETTPTQGGFLEISIRVLPSDGGAGARLSTYGKGNQQ